MKTLVLTGAAGFLGQAIARHFFINGWQVFGLDRISKGDIPREHINKYFSLNLPDPRFDKILSDCNPQAFIHAAGSASVPQSMLDPASDFRDGPALTFSMLNSLRQNAPDCAFIFLSSAAVYGNPAILPVNEDQETAPISVYGYHKLQSELLCREFSKLYGIKTACPRLFSAYGPGLRRQVIWDITHKAFSEPEIHLQGSGLESRDFIHCCDVARGLEQILLQAPMKGEAYNLASGNETTIAELLDIILAHLRITPKVVFSGEIPAGTPHHWKANIQRMNNLGFQPTISLSQGVTDFIDWYKTL
jgi:UDP-glucose 4-epimerase